MTHLRSKFKRKLRVSYPSGTGTLVVRTDLDWEHDIDPVAAMETRQPLKSRHSGHSFISSPV
jgi:hypothetical protein